MQCTILIYLLICIILWIKSQLIMVCDPLKILLNLVYEILLIIFYLFIRDIDPQFFFFLYVVAVWFWYQGSGDILESIWKYSLVSSFGISLRKLDIKYSISIHFAKYSISIHFAKYSISIHLAKLP